VPYRQSTHYQRSPCLEECLRHARVAGGFAPAPRIYRLLPLPMLGLLRMDEKGDAAQHPPLSIGRGHLVGAQVASQCGAMGTWAKRGRN
jgi:hypothetical protein